MPRRKPGVLLPRELLVLKVLAKGDTYGGALADAIEQPSRTVYNVLARLEKMGLVNSRWETPHTDRAERPRRVYTLTAKGRRAAGG